MHVHILGICGTFMGGIAAIAKAAGHRVTGSDKNVYPPMSTQLEALGIELISGFEAAQLKPRPDVVVVGNVMTRGVPVIEALLDSGIPYTSGPEWLAREVLRDVHVLGVAGTHGKTTTSSMLAWILEHAGLAPGFLIGGVPGNFSSSARFAPGTRYFVIEADEYDTAFFDKRAKFVHYRSRTLILNNLEFDHADIYDDLGAIQKQFHHLVRTVPASGRILWNASDANLEGDARHGQLDAARGVRPRGRAGRSPGRSINPKAATFPSSWCSRRGGRWARCAGTCWARTTRRMRSPPSARRAMPESRCRSPSRRWRSSRA